MEATRVGIRGFRADLAALQEAGQSLGQLPSAQGVDVEDIVADFKKARKQERPFHQSQGPMSSAAIVLDANIPIRAVGPGMPTSLGL